MIVHRHLPSTRKHGSADDTHAASRRRAKVVAALIAVHAAIAIFLSVNLNIWSDEGFSELTTSGSVAFAFSRGLEYDWNFPVFTTTLSLWRDIDSSLWFARLYSVTCSVVTLVIVYQISKRLLNRISPVWPVALLAVHPLMLAMACEMRMYALTTMLSALLIWLFLIAYWDPSPKLVCRWAYFAVLVIALHTHIFLLFLPCVFAVVLLIDWNPRRYFSFVLSTAAAAILFLPLLIYFTSLLDERFAAYDDPVTAYSAVKYVGGSISNMVLPLERDESAISRAARSMAALAVGAVFIYLLWTSFRHLAGRDRSFLLMTALLVLMLATFYVVTGTPGRQFYAYILFVPIVISAMLMIQARTRAIESAGPQFLAAVMVGCAIVGSVWSFAPMAKDGDWWRVGNYLADRAERDQPIVLFTNEISLLLPHYFHEPNRLVELPRPINTEHFNPHENRISSEEEIQDVMFPLFETHGTIWLVTYDAWWTGTEEFMDPYNHRQLERFLDQHAEIVSEQQFHGSSVRLLRAKSRYAANDLQGLPFAPGSGPTMNTTNGVGGAEPVTSMRQSGY